MKFLSWEVTRKGLSSGHVTTRSLSRNAYTNLRYQGSRLPLSAQFRSNCHGSSVVNKPSLPKQISFPRVHAIIIVYIQVASLSVSICPIISCWLIQLICPLLLELAWLTKAWPARTVTRDAGDRVRTLPWARASSGHVTMLCKCPLTSRPRAGSCDGLHRCHLNAYAP